jgi:hypothetical protein
MILGIVGHEGKKFGTETEEQAREVIRAALKHFNPTKVVSGACHLGGVDVWAIQEAKAAGVPTQEFPPQVLRWDGALVGKVGYKQRNLQIAAAADTVLCVVLKELPYDYKGPTFGDGCYHCRDRNPPHVKSGGCWTAWRCKEHIWSII